MATASDEFFDQVQELAGRGRDDHPQRLRQHDSRSDLARVTDRARPRPRSVPVDRENATADDLPDERRGVGRQADSSAANSGEIEVPPWKPKPTSSGRSIAIHG